MMNLMQSKEIAKETGATIIHAFDDPQIIAAQGVIGLETRRTSKCR